MKPFESRPIRFLEIIKLNNWQIKCYSISDSNEKVPDAYVQKAKSNLEQWLHLSHLTTLTNYSTATLLLHECKEGCFAIINWWVDDNMLQHFVFLTPNINSSFSLYSDSGVVTCVWETGGALARKKRLGKTCA
ncbi:MAG: hypothetical protein IPP34_18250 [Bacteroidetes bacterium]|nr:hypothetical protein [Bacteroidota bacterium]